MPPSGLKNECANTSNNNRRGVGREAQRVQVLGGGAAVVAFVGALGVEGQHRQRRAQPHAAQRGQGQRRRAPGERDDVPRGAPGQAGERLPRAAGTQDGVVVQRLQQVEAGRDAPQQRAQVVVLAEERVKAAVHLHRLAGGQPHRERPGASAQARLALQHGDADAALGQHDGRRHAGDAAAHHRDARRGAAGHRSASGRRARNEWTMPRCQPPAGSVRTAVKPASRRRCSNPFTLSKARTLSRR